MSRLVQSMPLVASDTRRFGGWWRYACSTEHRPVRVAVLVFLLAVLNVVDLMFTMLAVQQPGFIEWNVLAAGMGPGALVWYKLSLVSIGCGVLLWRRRMRLVELASWTLTGVYAALAVAWFALYGFLLRPETWTQFAAVPLPFP